MLTGRAQGVNRRAVVGLSVTSRLREEGETIMRPSLLFGCAILALISICNSTFALAQDAKGKNCHMEQQCHWENFKKICVYVKVCR
jgi:hypothetical protein